MHHGYEFVRKFGSRSRSPSREPPACADPDVLASWFGSQDESAVLAVIAKGVVEKASLYGMKALVVELQKEIEAQDAAKPVTEIE